MKLERSGEPMVTVKMPLESLRGVLAVVEGGAARLTRDRTAQLQTIALFRAVNAMADAIEEADKRQAAESEIAEPESAYMVPPIPIVDNHIKGPARARNSREVT